MNTRQQFRKEMGWGAIHESFNIRAVLLSTILSQAKQEIQFLNVMPFDVS